MHAQQHHCVYVVLSSGFGVSGVGVSPHGACGTTSRAILTDALESCAASLGLVRAADTTNTDVITLGQKELLRLSFVEERGFDPTVAADVPHRDVSLQQCLGDQLMPVAARWILLGTHDGTALLSGYLQ